MNFVALAVAILSLYSPVSGYSKDRDKLSEIQQAALEEVESDVMNYVEREIHCELSDRFKKELSLFLKNHGADNACNRKFLEIFLTNNMFDEMVEVTVNMYAPVANMAKCYDLLDAYGKEAVRNKETCIINVLKNRYRFSLNHSSRGDFVSLIRKHGSGDEVDCKLLRQFFSTAESGLFDSMASFIRSSKKEVDLVELRRSLQSNPRIFAAYDPKGKVKDKKQRCHNVAVHRQKGLFGGKKTRV